MQERRTAERVSLDLRARWEGLLTQGRGAVTDLSSSGCFVLTGGEVTIGELIRLQISFPREVEVVWGQVVYAIAEVGFALRFTFDNTAEQVALGRLVGSAN